MDFPPHTPDHTLQWISSPSHSCRACTQWLASCSYFMASININPQWIFLSLFLKSWRQVNENHMLSCMCANAFAACKLLQFSKTACAHTFLPHAQLLFFLIRDEHIEREVLTWEHVKPLTTQAHHPTRVASSFVTHRSQNCLL